MRQYTLPPHLDALLISDPVNISYLTNFVGVSPAERESFLLITRQRWYLLTFPLYKEEAETTQKQNKNLELQYISHGHSLSDILQELTQRYSIHTVGLESNSLTIHEYDLVAQLPWVRFIKGIQWIEPLRIIKDKTETESLKKACVLTDQCFDFIQKNIKVGMTEQQIAWEIEKFIKEHGGTLSFAPIVAFNQHSAIPHHIPIDDKRLTMRSLVLLDFGACVDNYHADMTRVIFVGTPKPEWINAYQIVQKAQREALEYLGTTQPYGNTADQIARQTIEQTGYQAYPHGLGHGVGLEIHEAPHLSIHRENPILPGMVFSVEPGIYLPGQFGIRIEDLVVKTTKGITLLSHAPYLQ